MEDSKLFVGSLSWGVDDAMLTEAFSQAGEVTSAYVIKDRDRGNRSKGFGFVEMASAEDAQKAIEMWDGQELDGREIVVNVAKPREESGGSRW